MSEDSEKPVKLLSFADDQPLDGRGTLIPRKKSKAESTQSFAPANIKKAPSSKGLQMAVTAAAVFALVVLGTTGYGLLAQSNLALAPTVTIVDPYTHDASPLEYGPQIALAKNNFFTETRDAFIDESLTFIEVDLTGKQLRFFKKGVLIQSAEVLGIGETGSWWETPSGLYKIEKKDERPFTTLGQVYLPRQLTFQGNFLIHGWPVYPDGSSVAADFVGGGIRLSDESASMLYQNVQVGTPVLVHQASVKPRDTFVYEAEVPELDAAHYFISDIENGTVLAATDLDEVVPIASLVKLMTAVVAAETIDLNGRVRVASPTFVTSLIPR